MYQGVQSIKLVGGILWTRLYVAVNSQFPKVSVSLWAISPALSNDMSWVWVCPLSLTGSSVHLLLKYNYIYIYIACQWQW